MYTPGPWQAQPEQGGAFTIWSGESQLGELQPDDMGDRLPAEANARLIAAAPDMLEALKAIVAKAHDYGNRSDVPNNAACGFYDIVEDARDAIAKAKGE